MTAARVLAAVLLAPALAAAADVPVPGRRLALRGGDRPAARVVVRDAAVAAPFPDPTTDSVLVVSGGAGPGQCFASIPLDAAGWEPLRGDGAQRGWRWRAAAPGMQGVRRVVVRPGVLLVVARGAGWPCGLGSPAQREPVTVTLRTGGSRWCAAFGGTVTRNAPGRFTARNAPAPAACPDADVTVASLNILHGVFCPAPSAQCRLADRVGLLFQWIAASGCPDVVALQEIQGAVAVPLIAPLAATTCPFPYAVVHASLFGIDDSVVLTRHPPAASVTTLLYKGFRHVHHVRIDHPRGPLDVFNTHLASGSDGAGNPCTGDCPPECTAAGAPTVRACQGVQLAAIASAGHADLPGMPAVVVGDLNDAPGSFVHQHFVGSGFVDTYLAAGNPECEPLTGVGCTSGRIDDALTDLESPVANVSHRIDYAFLLPPAPGAGCTPVIDSAADLDGDGTATRIFADAPNPFAPTCGPSPDPICWPSDHEGAELDLACD